MSWSGVYIKLYEYLGWIELDWLTDSSRIPHIDGSNDLPQWHSSTMLMP